MKLSVKDLEAIDHVEFRNMPSRTRGGFTGISTDSRMLRKGELFVALRGERFDGHEFVEAAFSQGARAALVDEAFRGDLHTPLLVVKDTVKALGELARNYRRRFTVPVIAVAGSNGKTTTKEMIARVLGRRHAVLKTEGNHNNQIGVPLTLLRLSKRHKLAVVELGTNHPGEMEYLCGIVEPTHGLVTNIGHEHLEFFKDLDGVAREEGSLFAYLRRRPTSVAFVNADDRRIAAFARRMKRTVRYGFTTRGVDVRGEVAGLDNAGRPRLRFTAAGKRTGHDVRLRIAGSHNAVNALAAAAVGMTFRIPPKEIVRALASFVPSSKRMETLLLNGVIVYNDTYNANPDSTIAALHTLAAAKVRGKKIAVLADMLELGEGGPAEHERVGRETAKLNLHYVLTYGSLAKHIRNGAGMETAIHYEDKNMLAEYLAELAAPGDAVLVKGSRGMRMEDVVTFLQARLEPGTVQPAEA
jgi:UDP-N-acetylmuramoyl-tripeptide--D-alanyl-D-alanine ligase